MIKIEVANHKMMLRLSAMPKKSMSVELLFLKVKGTGKSIAPSIHASKETEMYSPEFSDKYKLEVILPNDKENDVIEIIRANSKIGKIFIWPIARAVDIESAVEDEQAI